MTDDLLTLRVWSKVISGWQSVEIVDSIDALSPTFSLRYTDRQLDSDDTLRVLPGDLCFLRIGDDQVLAGHVDETVTDEDASSRSLSVSGRAMTGDLVDCAVLRRPASWHNATVEQIARDICAPFNIGVTVADGTDLGGPYVRFAIEPGETCLDCLSRAARGRGLILRTSPAGFLVITSVGAWRSSTVLRGGDNLLSSSRALSLAERFSEVRVRSQSDGEDLFGRTSAQAEAVAKDPNVRRYRPLVVLDDAGQGTRALRRRADWEVAARLGRGSRVSVRLHGWRDGDGQLWRANTLVRMRHDWHQIDADLLIVAVRLSLDSGGTRATLELCAPEAYRPEPVAQKRKEVAPWP